MKLLPEELKLCLPPLGSQAEEGEPIVYTRFFVPGTLWSYYVTEGQPEADDYRCFGFLVETESIDDWNWRSLLLSELQNLKHPSLQPVERDIAFEPGPITKVAVLPWPKDDPPSTGQ